MSTIEAEADAADARLKEVFADGKMGEPRYRRYVLVQRPDGRLEFSAG